MADSATSTKNSKISYDGVDYDVVREGLAEILNPAQNKPVVEGKEDSSQQQAVFYNPIQQFNRDLSVLAIRVFAEQLVKARSQKHGKRKQSSARANKRRKLEKDNTADASGERDASKAAETENAIEKETTNQPEDNDIPMEDLELLAQHSSDLDVSTAKELQGNGAKVPAGPAKPANGSQRPAVRALDALSASGLRALRYAKEIPNLTDVVANDMSVAATKAININIKHNNLEDKITINTGNALDYMYKSKAKFEIVDLDPYGTAGPFLDAAVQALTSGGLLCVTCTDSAVFAAAGYCEKTYALYGGMPIKGPHSHEGGLRLLLNAIATSASRYGLAIEPLLSLSIDFYIRVFVRIRRSPQEVKLLACKSMIVYGCDSGCGSWTTQPLGRFKAHVAKNGAAYQTYLLAQAPSANTSCTHCGFTTHLHGPMWAGPIHNPYFVQTMLDTLQEMSVETYGTKARMEGMLITARDEVFVSGDPQTDSTGIARLPVEMIDHHPFFFLPSVVSSVLHCGSPSAAHLRGALLRLGYRVTRSHAKPGSVKTDAPWNIIWEVMREWIRQEKPVKEESIKPASAGRVILNKRREETNSISAIKDELRVLSENREAEESDVRTTLESILFRLSGAKTPADNINGTEENGPAAVENKVPVHNLKIVFDEALGKKSEENHGNKLVRYQVNPRPNWGPMARAKG